MSFKATRKIALEEHFAIEATVQDSAGFVPPSYWVELKQRLLDIQGRRIDEMDQNGVELMILSLNAPTVQAVPNIHDAYDLSRRANDFLADQIAKRPDRFKGFAALPMQSPELAARELERCVKELNFVGALVNGFSQVEGSDAALYYDLPQYRPFWSVVETLDVPFYLHPRNPLAAHAPIYDGHPWLLGPTWAFGQETAVHALRLMGSGLFDAYPRLKIILGHMGEGLPYSMWRIDNRNAWVKTEPNYPAKKRIAEYFHHIREFPDPDLDRRDARNRIRPHSVFGGLALRERRSRGALVRPGCHQRERPRKDRKNECGAPLQAGAVTRPRQGRSLKRRSENTKME